MNHFSNVCVCQQHISTDIWPLLDGAILCIDWLPLYVVLLVFLSKSLPTNDTGEYDLTLTSIVYTNRFFFIVNEGNLDTKLKCWRTDGPI